MANIHSGQQVAVYANTFSSERFQLLEMQQYNHHNYRDTLGSDTVSIHI